MTKSLGLVVGSLGVIHLCLECASDSLNACLNRLGDALKSAIVVTIGLVFQRPKVIGDVR